MFHVAWRDNSGVDTVKKKPEPNVHDLKTKKHTRTFFQKLLGLQEHSTFSRMDLPLRVASVVKVPDLIFNGYRHPEFSSQYIINFNHPCRRGDFKVVVVKNEEKT